MCTCSDVTMTDPALAKKVGTGKGRESREMSDSDVLVTLLYCAHKSGMSPVLASG